MFNPMKKNMSKNDQASHFRLILSVESILKLDVVCRLRLLVFPVIFICTTILTADDSVLAKITIKENAGFARHLEYVECHVQISKDNLPNSSPKFIIEDVDSGLDVSCQIIEMTEEDSNDDVYFRIMFPVSIGVSGKNDLILKLTKYTNPPKSGLKIRGSGFDLIVENNFYRADLSKNKSVEPQSYDSGQMRELLIKMGVDQLLTNVEDRLHWAPNFKRPELEWYTTIAHWSTPIDYTLKQGPHVIQTIRQDLAPGHPEISLTAVYQFYDNLPFFKFYSEMKMVEDVWLELLRNDEMTMDSMFTHLAFQRPNGEIVDITFSERKILLEDSPIENESPWICFYNDDKGFAFGSIRLRYENSNELGAASPTYQPHTQIGEWLGGITYWNRRLIHDHLTFVPKGSRYIEENAYLVFKINENNRFENIKYWADRLQHPLDVQVHY